MLPSLLLQLKKAVDADVDIVFFVLFCF